MRECLTLLLLVAAAPSITSDYTAYASDTGDRTRNGESILLYTTENEGAGLGVRRWDYDEDLPAVLATDGFTVTVEDRETIPQLSGAILATYDQLWLVSTEEGPILNASEVDAIQDFHSSGKGILIIGDGCSYDGPANQISAAIGVQYTDSPCCHCDHCGGPVGCAMPTSGFVPHVIWDNVVEIQANLNEGDISATTPSVLIAVDNGIGMVAIRDSEGGRVAWDATVYRFTDASTHSQLSIAHYDNAQYALNLANWLAGRDSVPSATAYGLIAIGLLLASTALFVLRRRIFTTT